MPDLSFSITKVEPTPASATPMLNFELQVQDAEKPALYVQTVVLRCLIRIEPSRRLYNASEESRLLDLFGSRDCWSQTLHPLLWTHAQLIIPAFSEYTAAELQVPCSFDINIAATKYFHSIEEADIPLRFLFSGTVFYQALNGQLQAAPVSLRNETEFRLPIHVWKQMIEVYYPNSAWLSLRRDVFDQLYAFKSRHALPTWEQTIEQLLASAAQELSR